MRRKTGLLTCLLAVTALATFLMAADRDPKPDPKIDFPDFRSWTHVKTMVIHDESHPLFESFGGIHHVYANSRALPSTSTRKPYPDGSLLAFVLYDLEAQEGAYSAGSRKLTAVMEKKGKYRDTGGWGFQAWGRDGKPIVFDGGGACFACHRDGAASTDFVFSRYTP